jgi:DNA invertase Pin-like site-specific DNA recombinase
MLAVFAEFERDMLRERVRGGLERVRREGKRLGRPPTAASHTTEVRALRRQRLTHAEIARQLGIGESSVRRILAAKAPAPPSRRAGRRRGDRR